MAHYAQMKKLTKYLDQILDYLDKKMYEKCVAAAENILNIINITRLYVEKARNYICHCSSKVSCCTFYYGGSRILCEWVLF